MKKNNKILLTLFMGIIILSSFSFFGLNLNLKNNNGKNLVYSNPNNDVIKASSTNWVLNQMIHIKNNWSETEATYDWCSGDGTFINPYKIEGVIFKNMDFGNCINIENTIEYFVIKNCTIDSSGLNWSDAAIQLTNVLNGVVMNNTIQNNLGIGISLNKSTFNSIKDNICYNNSYMGIRLEESNNNSIISNQCNLNGEENSGYGISLRLSESNNISMNIASNNKASGIILFNSSYNIIQDNTAQKNIYGVFLSSSSNNNTITSNNLVDNKYCTLVGETCENNVVDENNCGNYPLERWALLILFVIITVIGVFVFVRVNRDRKKIKKEKKDYGFDNNSESKEVS